MMEQSTIPDFTSYLQQFEARLKALEEKNSIQLPTIEQPISIQQAARYLLLEVPTIYNLVSSRKLPHHKISKRLYFYKSELSLFIRESRRYTNNGGAK